MNTLTEHSYPTNTLIPTLDVRMDGGTELIFSGSVLVLAVEIIHGTTDYNVIIIFTITLWH
jgi:hypothetical protein